MIGRAEQADAARGVATSYACQNCCPDSFFDAFTDGCFEPLFVEDTTQLHSFQRDADCYNQVHDSYAVSSVFNWISFDPGIVSVDGGGFVQGVGVGDTSVQAQWYADRWLYSTLNESCEHSLEQVAANAFCSVSGIGVDVSPSEIRPAGTGGTNTATVTVRTGPRAIQGVSVTLALESVWHSGGHAIHTGVRPNGTLAQTQGVTDASGKFTTTYTAPVFGGTVRIIAVDTNSETSVTIKVAGLASLGGGANYQLRGALPEHPDNHYGTATALQNLPLIADDYKALFYPDTAIPDADRLGFNDMSLVNGGKFEIAGDWSLANERHAEHRVGINCDLWSSNVPSSRRSALTDIFRARGTPRYADETATLNHWHLRFE